MSYKILNMSDISLYPDIFKSLKPIADVKSIPAKQEYLLKNIGKYDAYFSSLYVRVDKKVIDKAEKLKVIATPSTGTDHIDVEYAKKKGIEILSLKKDTRFLSNITATAEMAWALLLAVVRRLPWSFEDAKKGVWARDKYRGHQLSGKTLGILGYGRLGRIVAEYGKAFCMKVIACDIKRVRAEKGVELVGFGRLLKESDVISIHIHLTKENRGIINAGAFSRMKKGTVLINTSRGAVINEKAFLKALKSGELAGAGVDVIEGEWDKNLKKHPLIKYANKHQNLVISPHTGGVTFESQRMTMEFTVNKLRKYLKNL